MLPFNTEYLLQVINTFKLIHYNTKQPCHITKYTENTIFHNTWLRLDLKAWIVSFALLSLRWGGTHIYINPRWQQKTGTKQCWVFEIMLWQVWHVYSLIESEVNGLVMLFQEVWLAKLFFPLYILGSSANFKSLFLTVKHIVMRNYNKTVL